MTALLLQAILAMFNPANWRAYPPMDEIRCMSANRSQLFVAVPKGVYILNRDGYRYARCLTSADGLEGEVRLCAYNQAHPDLLVSTDNHLYAYVPATGLVAELHPPFSRASSIGIAGDGAYFETKGGTFRKHRVADQFDRVQSIPRDVVWYGERDTTKPEDFVFLTPYFVTDKQLISHRLTTVRPDRNGRRLFVGSEQYGLLVYNSRTGLPEAHVRMGPTALPPEVAVVRDGAIWLLSRNHSAGVDSDGNWQYYRTEAGTPLPAGLRLMFGSANVVAADQQITSLLPDSGRLLISTTDGIRAFYADGRSSEVARLTRGVNAMAEFRDSILVATDDGLLLLQGDSLSRLDDPLARTDWGVFAIAVSGGRTLWLGVTGGVLQLDSGNNWQQIIPPGLDLSRRVRAIAATDSLLFIGGDSVITVYNNPDASFRTVGPADGLPQGDIRNLICDGRYLWIASDAVLTRFDFRRFLAGK